MKVESQPVHPQLLLSSGRLSWLDYRRHAAKAACLFVPFLFQFTFSFCFRSHLFIVASAQTATLPTKNCRKSLRKREREEEFTKRFKLDPAKGSAFCRYCSSKMTCANVSYFRLEKQAAQRVRAEYDCWSANICCGDSAEVHLQQLFFLMLLLELCRVLVSHATLSPSTPGDLVFFEE